MVLLLAVYKNPILQDKHYVLSGPEQVKHYIFLKKIKKKY